MGMRAAIIVLLLAGCGPLNGGLDPSTTCASGLVWTAGNTGSPQMNPGHACIACHAVEKKSLVFAAAGTVYAQGGEPNGCAGTATGMSIELTDANGKTVSLTPNAAGNFYLEGTLATPYRARLVHPGGVREMATPQTNGDCNSCHTAAGLEGAPGRISP